MDNAKKNDYMNIPAVRDAIHALEEEFSKDGRVLIRTSGTEPVKMPLADNPQMA